MSEHQPLSYYSIVLYTSLLTRAVILQYSTLRLSTHPRCHTTV
jgi:hypothetical protein